MSGSLKTRQKYENKTQTNQRVRALERPIRSIVTKLTTVSLTGEVTVTGLTTQNQEREGIKEC